MSAEDHRKAAPSFLGFALITISDTRTLKEDMSGRALHEMVQTSGHHVVGTALVADEAAVIRETVEKMLGEPDVDVVVTTGGTGFSPRDVTLDAVLPILEKPIEGFGELFRMLSYQQVKAAAMLSRAAAGLVGGKAVFLLPGSPKAVALAMDELILPEAAHLIGQARRQS